MRDEGRIEPPVMVAGRERAEGFQLPEAELWQAHSWLPEEVPKQRGRNWGLGVKKKSVALNVTSQSQDPRSPGESGGWPLAEALPAV